MHLKVSLDSADEFTAAAAFCTAMAEARRKEADRRPAYGFGIDNAASIWRRYEEAAHRVAAEPEEKDVTAGEVVDALNSALTQVEDADGVEFPSEPAAAPKKRGRPRKAVEPADGDIDPAVVAGIQARADEVLQGEVLEPVSGQIDIEDVIADSMAEAPSIVEDAIADSMAEAHSIVEELTDEPPQPADPAVGWTLEDGREAARTMLNRAGPPEIGNPRLFKVLDTFGVKQVKALQPDQIEAFVIATTKEVF